MNHINGRLNKNNFTKQTEEYQQYHYIL